LPIAVLWIRIRKNPKVLTVSESEKKFGFGSRHCCRMKIFMKIRRSNTWKRKILFYSIETTIFSDVQVLEHIWKQLESPFRKISGQNISLRIRIRIWIRKKKFVTKSEKMSSDPQHWPIVAYCLRILLLIQIQLLEIENTKYQKIDSPDDRTVHVVGSAL
jgi:hypothetical protein